MTPISAINYNNQAFKVLNFQSTSLILIYPFRIYEYTDILCVNESEAQIILGQEDPIETEADIEKGMNLLLLKCPIIVITLGKFF